MDADEEQNLEIEALDAIFGNDFVLVNTESPRVFTLRLLPFTGGNEENDNHVAVSMICNIPGQYPYVLPVLEFKPLIGLLSKHCDLLVSVLLYFFSYTYRPSDMMLFSLKSPIRRQKRILECQ